MKTPRGTDSSRESAAAVVIWLTGGMSDGRCNTSHTLLVPLHAWTALEAGIKQVRLLHFIPGLHWNKTAQVTSLHGRTGLEAGMKQVTSFHARTGLEAGRKQTRLFPTPPGLIDV